MLEQLEALRALKETGTTARAAVRLRLTQSAVSKRIAALEAQVGASLVERAGRGGRLTPAGERLLAGAVPLLAQLRDVVAASAGERGPRVVRLAASESLLSSWLPAVLVKVRSALPGVTLELHAHRGPVLVARVAAGDADLAIAVDAAAEEGLVSRPLGDEPLVLMPSGMARLKVARGEMVECWAIEERSLTWASLAPRLARRDARREVELKVTGRLESFSALARCAAAGLAHAMVPRGVALAAGAPREVLVPLPGLERPLALIGRKQALQREPVAAFARELEKGVRPLFGKRRQ